MEEEGADQGTSARQIHAGFAKRAQQSNGAASCVEGRGWSMGKGMRWDRAGGC